MRRVVLMVVVAVAGVIVATGIDYVFGTHIFSSEATGLRNLLHGMFYTIWGGALASIGRDEW